MRRYTLFLLLAILIPALTACKKVGGGSSSGSGITFDGQAISVSRASYSHSAGQTTLWLEFGDQGTLRLTFSDTILGQRAELSSAADPDAPWWWEIDYYMDGAGLYSGKASDMNHIASGSITCMRMGDGQYILGLDILSQDNKRLKGQYGGKFSLRSL